MTHTDPAEVFRVEAQELLEKIEQGLLDLERTPQNSDLVAQVFRALHTLKGSGAMFGFDALAAFTHHCETAFDRVRKGEVSATPKLIAAVLAAQDHMRALVEGGEAPQSVGDALLADLQKAVSMADSKAPAAPEPEPERTWHITFRLVRDALVNGTRPLPLLDELRALGTCEIVPVTSSVPPLAELNPVDCHLAWDITLKTRHPRSAIEDVFIFVGDDFEPVNRAHRSGIGEPGERGGPGGKHSRATRRE